VQQVCVKFCIFSSTNVLSYDTEEAPLMLLCEYSEEQSGFKKATRLIH